MKKEYILFIDSGVGGLSTLAKTMQLTPANYIYFADNLHSPYGDRTDHEIFEFLRSIIEDLTKKYSIKIVVLACNTATTSSIGNLRTLFKDLVFVGTEPAIKLASAGGAKSVLCLATPTTAKQVRFKALLSSANCRVKTLALPSFAMDIERFFLEADGLSRFLLQRDLLRVSFAAQKADAVVLGCTHYSLVSEMIKKEVLMPVYDGNFGVAKQVSRAVKSIGQKSHVKFIFSKHNTNSSQKYRKILNQILAKQNNVC